MYLNEKVIGARFLIYSVLALTCDHRDPIKRIESYEIISQSPIDSHHKDKLTKGVFTDAALSCLLLNICHFCTVEWT